MKNINLGARSARRESVNFKQASFQKSFEIVKCHSIEGEDCSRLRVPIMENFLSDCFCFRIRDNEMTSGSRPQVWASSTEETGVKRFVKYSGAMPCKPLYVNVHSL